MSMSRRRCALSCEGTSSRFSLPKDEEMKTRWLRVTFDAPPPQYSLYPVLCSRHFTEDPFAKRLVLKDDALPTLFFPFMGMLCRLYLAVMHYNENAKRRQAIASPGQTVLVFVFLKPVKTDPTYNYVGDLMKLVFEEVFEDPVPFVEELEKIPIPEDLTSQYDRPSAEEVVARHQTCFSQVAARSQYNGQPDQETLLVNPENHTQWDDYPVVTSTSTSCQSKMSKSPLGIESDIIRVLNKKLPF
ncbi:uncharacterized protein LOC118100128 [Hippoglossus stenolepis]|uniref:uncharacterized protein LOC118100128 n=1 Tax=Hippoglossus stenolepis TaxID=195615 RepID=UPI001FAF6241|nr:uncharacterized protein LOC118100128 [Hippoglossus stenolepis]